jgi:AcrR family transcriptional regulator
MGISERKEREKEEMRRLILRAAHKLFLENGFEKTSIRAIADLIEYSPATIYLYFRDKNELFFELHEEAFQLMGQYFSVISTISDPFAQLVELGHLYTRWAVENPELYDLCFLMEAPMEALACRGESWKEGIDTFEMLKQVIDNCVKAGYFKEQDLDTVALTVWSYMHGLVTIYLKDRMDVFEDKRDMSRITDSYSLFTNMIRNGL